MTKMTHAGFEKCPWCETNDDISLQQVDIEDREGTPVRMICKCSAAAPYVYVKNKDYFEALATIEWNKRKSINIGAELEKEKRYNFLLKEVIDNIRFVCESYVERRSDKPADMSREAYHRLQAIREIINRFDCIPENKLKELRGE